MTNASWHNDTYLMHNDTYLMHHDTYLMHHDTYSMHNDMYLMHNDTNVGGVTLTTVLLSDRLMVHSDGTQ